ncbi:MAG: FtsW/RodA/SpoVE family cell cycle protein [Clostridia bacterium]|nr:FtsW/RodA/SpoVE family cell cycle protein [Clostridia bacterium]
MAWIISYKRPVSLIVLADIMAFALLYFYKKPFDWYILLAGFIVISLICTTYFIIVKKSLGDEYLFLIVSMLASIGFIMIYRLERELGFKQIVWFAGGLVLFFISYYIFLKIRFWDKLIVYYIAAAILLFTATLVFGENIKGSTNWIVIAGYSFQPAELIKIIFIFTLACFYKRAEQYISLSKKLLLPENNLMRKLAVSLISYSFIVFLILQRDWGSALLFFMIHFTMLYIFEKSYSFLLVNAITAFIGGIGGFLFLYHIKVRFDTWINPWSDIAGKGYQITQSLFAIATGGFFGTGIGMGRPDLIPEVNTDFIFSAICEEMGIFGGVAVILLYFILTYRGFKIALSVDDMFRKVVALGITAVFGFQTFIIVGGVIKLIPLTGITLPFISYGGSSLTTSFIALGILQAISSTENIKREV